MWRSSILMLFFLSSFLPACLAQQDTVITTTAGLDNMKPPPAPAAPAQTRKVPVYVGWETPVNKDRLFFVNGLNLNADLISIAGGLIGLPYVVTAGLKGLGPAPYNYPIVTTINGFSISIGGTGGISSNNIRMNGVSLNGLINTACELRGLHITGTQNRADDFSGVVISGLLNNIYKGRGLQIALVNVCKDLKGVQLGLWNVNSKRKLPFVNWSF